MSSSILVEDVLDGDENSVGTEYTEITVPSSTQQQQQRDTDGESFGDGYSTSSIPKPVVASSSSSVVSGIFNATGTTTSTTDFNRNSIWNAATGGGTTGNPHLKEAPDNDDDTASKPFVPFRGGDIPTDTFEDEGMVVVDDPNKNNNINDNVDGVFVNIDAGLDENGNSLPHPEETITKHQYPTHSGYNKRASTGSAAAVAVEDVDASNLGENGNSLPHPSAIKNVNSMAINGGNDANDNLLHRNGSSLPHPETIKKISTTSKTVIKDDSTDIDAMNLGENGNSLPHPDAMRNVNNSMDIKGCNDVNENLLHRNGSSLPHPETIKKISTTSKTVIKDDSADIDAMNLGENGNSLPHPDAMRSANNSMAIKGGNDVNDNLLHRNGSSLPHPETIKKISTTSKTVVKDDSTDIDAMNLVENGNSLAHPDTMVREKCRTLMNMNPGNTDVNNNENLLDDNGRSLPHPDTIKKISTTSKTVVKDDSTDIDAMNLGENGNSLPHPDSVKDYMMKVAAMHNSKKKGSSSSDKVDDKLLVNNGNTLPHPDSLKQFGRVAGATKPPGSAAAAAGSSAAAAAAAANSAGENRLFENGNSLPHPDEVNRYTPAAHAASVQSVIENDHYIIQNDAVLDSLEDASDASNDDDDDDDEEHLDDNGNSLPHVEESMLMNSNNNNAATGSSSSRKPRWRNLLSPFSTKNKRSRRTANSSSSNNNNIDMTTNLSPFEDETNDDDDNSSSDMAVNGAETPVVANAIATGQQQHPQSSWQTLGQTVLSSLHYPTAMPVRDGEADLFLDEEVGGSGVNTTSTGLNSNNHENLPFAYEVEHFNDEDDRDMSSMTSSRDKNSATSGRTRDGLLLTSSRGKYTWRCYLLIFAIFLIILGMAIPLIALALDRRNNNGQEISSSSSNNDNNNISKPPIVIPVDNDDEDTTTPDEPLPTPSPIAPVPSPTTAPPDDTITCEDELLILDENGDAITNVEDGSHELCFTTTQYIQLRYTYCDPTSTEDWLGLFPSRSLFMDRVYKRFLFGKILQCVDGDDVDDTTSNVDGIVVQPQRSCTSDDLGKPQRKVLETSPIIQDPGEYRFFILKHSNWPYEYVTYSKPFRIVEDDIECKNDNIFFDMPVSSNSDPTLQPTSSSFVFDENSSSEDDGSVIGNVLGDLIGGITGNDELGDKVEDKVNDVVDDVNDFVDDVGDKVSDVVDGVGDFVDDVGDKVDDFGDKVDDFGDKIEDVFDGSSDEDFIDGVFVGDDTNDRNNNNNNDSGERKNVFDNNNKTPSYQPTMTFAPSATFRPTASRQYRYGDGYR